MNKYLCSLAHKKNDFGTPIMATTSQEAAKTFILQCLEQNVLRVNDSYQHINVNVSKVEEVEVQISPLELEVRPPYFEKKMSKPNQS